VPTASRWSLIVGNTDTGMTYPAMSDREIAYCWLYGDLVHADDDKIAAVAHVDSTDRLFAALALIRDVIAHVQHTQRLIDAVEDAAKITTPVAKQDQQQNENR
jgi:hypothetical protein